MPTTLLFIAEASQAVAATRGRNEKRDRLASVIATLDADVRAIGIAFLMGELAGGKIGIGWAAVRDLDVGAAPRDATVTLIETSRASSRSRRRR